MMENLLKKKNVNSLESILKDLEEADNVGAMVLHSRRAAVWVAQKHPGMALLGQDVAKIFKAENLDKSEFLNAFTAELIRQRRKCKIDKTSTGLRTTDSKKSIRLSKFAIPGQLKPKLEKG